MLKIYDLNHDPLGYIINYKDLKIESDLNAGDKSLSVEYLAQTKRKEIKGEYYIETKTDEYVVKSVETTDRGTQNICAAINLEELAININRMEF